MKKLYLLFLIFISSLTGYTQCNFSFQLNPQSSCDTTCNSTFVITAMSGPGNYDLFVNGILHSNFTTAATVGPVCPGSYIIQIDDGVSCFFTDTIEIVTNPPLSVIMNSQLPTCQTCNDGQSTAVASGGNPPYNYIWSMGANTQSIVNLSPGIYCVTVVDNMGCTASVCESLNLTNCGFTVNHNPQSYCDTSCIGSAFVYSTGNIGPYHIFLDSNYYSSFSIGNLISGLCPGQSYDIFVTDSVGCNFNYTLLATTNQPLVANIVSQSPSCPTCNDGSAIVNVTGGNQSYNYLWSNNQTSSAIQNLHVGSYCVTVTDGNGCSITACDTLGLTPGNSLINGTVFLDLDQNGIYNFPEPGLGNMQININPGGFTGWTSSSGVYFVSVPDGSYNISVNTPLNWQQTTLPLTYNVNVFNQVSTGNDFGFLHDTTTAFAEITLMASLPRCNAASTYHIRYRNMGAMLAQGEVIFNMDPLVTFVNAYPPPNNVTGNTYTWEFDSLYPFVDNYTTLNVTMPGAGNVLNSSAIINLRDSSSTILFSDTVYKIQTVACSFDPNDKMAEPTGLGAQNAVPLNTSEVDFTIRFQNTGNDTAFVVVLKDTLDADLDLSTFEIIAASHEMFTQMDPGGILTFTFENILLPDSNVNEPMSHGFVSYRIKPLQPVIDPTVITNTAYIYFDLNPAIVTNTTLTTFSDNLLSVTELNEGGKIKAYPNPFADEVIIEFENKSDAKAELFDYLGRNVRQLSIKNSSSFILKRENLIPGLYLLKISTDKSSAIIKLKIQ